MVELLPKRYKRYKNSAETCKESLASETTPSSAVESEYFSCCDTDVETKTTETDWKVEHARKCEVFNEWCRSNGVKWPKVQYPSYFEGGLVGVKAIEPIEHREAFMSIPYKMLMTVDAAQKHPVIGKIIEENPQLFSEDEKGDWE